MAESLAGVVVGVTMTALLYVLLWQLFKALSQ